MVLIAYMIACETVSHEENFEARPDILSPNDCVFSPAALIAAEESMTVALIEAKRSLNCSAETDPFINPVFNASNAVIWSLSVE